MAQFLSDTICAQATPPGASGLAVIRISGPNAFTIVDLCFKGKTSIAKARSHKILYGNFYDRDTLIDAITVSIFRAPRSYTGDDVVEIGCHGGVIVSELIIKTLISSGCRFAEPGEFTKRAFLNGKIDLSQAEAVADMIHSSSQIGSAVSARQIAGGFSNRIISLRENLLDICALLEAELDFAHEDIEFVDKAKMMTKLEEVKLFCNNILETHRSSNIIRDGLYVGIVGYPNAGKSTLFNALLGKNRSIVSNTPGTTRDYIEETIHIQGSAIRFFDTAGLRDAEDTIEIEGIRMAESVIEQCNILFVINDSTISGDNSLPLYLNLCKKYPEAIIFYLQNKIDATDNFVGMDDLPISRKNIIKISARDGIGIPLLRQHLSDIITTISGRLDDFLLNSRHAAHLDNIIRYIDSAIDSTNNNMPNEFISLDIKSSVLELGKLTGATFGEEVLERIFSRFCIGK